MINGVAIMETPFNGLTIDGSHDNLIYAYHGAETYDIILADGFPKIPIGVFSFSREIAFNTTTNEPNLLLEIKQLSGIFSVINCSIGALEPVEDYNFDPTEFGRFCFNKGTENVWAAGNWDGQLITDTKPIWQSWIDKTIASPYLMVAGALGRTAQNPNNWDVADYSMANPRFVTFMLSGYTIPVVDANSPSGFNGSQGTSFAAPRLSAFISQIVGAHPEYNMSQIMTTLMNNQTPFVSIEKNNWIEEALLGDRLKTTTESIDTSILVENAYEVFLGRHANPTELSMMITNLNTGNQTSIQALTWFETNSNYTQKLCPLQQQVEGLYHLFLGRDGNDVEIDTSIQYYANNAKENWAKFCKDWSQYYKIGILNNYHFGVE